MLYCSMTQVQVFYCKWTEMQELKYNLNERKKYKEKQVKLIDVILSFKYSLDILSEQDGSGVLAAADKLTSIIIVVLF